MPRTAIKVSNVINASSKGTTAKSKVAGAETGIGNTRCAIDGKILNRNNINNRLINVKNSVGQIENDIAEICAVINSGAMKYQTTENNVVRHASIVIGNYRVKENVANTSGKKYSALFRELSIDDMIAKGVAAAGAVVNAATVQEKEPEEVEKKKNIWDYIKSGIDVLDGISGIDDYLPSEELVLAGKMIGDGLIFKTVTDARGRINLQIENHKELTHAQMGDVLKKYVTDSKLTDYDIRSMVNDGLPVYKTNGNTTTAGKKIVNNINNNTDKLLDITGALNSKKTISSRFAYAGNAFKTTFADEMKEVLNYKSVKNVKDIVNFDNFGSLTKAEKIDDILVKAGKTGEVLGFVGDVMTVGTEFYENNYNPETQSWEFTPQSVVSTVTDVAIDFATSAGATAAGAAIGSFIVPPVGTVVGAAAGLAIDALINWEVDINGDGEKNSVVGLVKDGVDAAVDVIGDGLNAVGDFFGKGIDKMKGWFS